jgi:uncharacterized membrane protein YfcA
MLSLKFIKTLILGVSVGLLGGIQGQAGALYILTGLIMFNIVESQQIAAGTALLYTSVPVTLGAAYEYYKRKEIDWMVALVLIPTVIVASIIGAKINPLIPPKYTLYSISLTSFVISLYFLHKGLNTKP